MSDSFFWLCNNNRVYKQSKNYNPQVYVDVENQKCNMLSNSDDDDDDDDDDNNDDDEY